jgi:hypothetical protein
MEARNGVRVANEFSGTEDESSNKKPAESQPRSPMSIDNKSKLNYIAYIGFVRSAQV